MSTLSNYWKRLLPEWRFALAAYLFARLTLTLWSLAVYAWMPLALQNLDLFGKPVLTAFDPRTSERHAYSRLVGGDVLSFRVLDSAHAVDDQTGSVWSLRDGTAIRGAYVGRSLAPAEYSAEMLFPYLGVPPAKSVLLSPWQRFDANWYLKIAARGYNGSDGSTVYFPAYPFLVRILAFLSEPMLAAMLVSNLALIGSLVLLYRLAAGLADAAIARRALAYFLIFPTAFFLTAPYTESLFLLFTLGSLYAASRRRWGWSALWGALAALTRLQGVLLVVPLAYMLWNQSRGMPVTRLIVRALPLLAIPAATVGFLAFSNLSLLNTYQGTLHAKFVFPWENIFSTISLLAAGKGGLVDALNLLVTLWLIAMLYFVWKKLPLEYAFYSLLMLFAPLLRMTTTQPLVSMTRYALAVFPVFIVLGMWGENRWVNRAVVYTSVPLQLYLSAQFILWGWVA